MMAARLPALGLLALLVAPGCGSEPDPGSVSLQEPVPAPLPDDVQRSWRRMDLEQLDASIRAVTGGIGWDDEQGRSQLDQLASSLGAADYLAGKPEDLSVSLLFVKFLEDAAADVCGQLVAREAGEPSADNAFMVHAALTDTAASEPEAVRQNLAHALLRFHGRRVPPHSQELEPWLFLLESATLVGESPADGWETVCVGLITHPDFYTY